MKENMMSFNNYLPGREVKEVLLYFPTVDAYKTSDPKNCEGTFVFEESTDEGKTVFVEAVASHWMKLK